MRLYDISGFAMDNSVIIHSGVKGMQWGRRRYQNRDGTLTPEGKKRYSKNTRLRENFKDDLKYELAKKRFGMSGIRNIDKLVNERDFTIDDAIKEQEAIRKTLNVTKKIASVGVSLGVSAITANVLSSVTPILMEKATAAMSNPETIERGRQIITQIFNKSGELKIDELFGQSAS